MTIAELVVLMHLLLKFTWLENDESSGIDDALTVCRAVARRMVKGWGHDSNIESLTDIPF